jgi:DNA repair exonuclease SbcCD ATPase subunit
MHILTLQIENIKRVSAAFITANGESVVTIGGKNGHGKSSCIDSIAMALGGKKLCPPEPLRRGEASGHITLDLGAYIITRRFWRSDDSDAVQSSLVVTSPDGASYKSPQALLDKLVSDLTFDPLAFLDLQPAGQREYVRKLVGLDFKALDAQRAAALEAARECETVLKVAEHDVKAGEYYEGAPTTPVDVAALLAEMEGAEAFERAAVEAERAIDSKRAAYQVTLRAITENDKQIALLEQQLDAARAHGVALAATKVREEEDGQELRRVAASARAAVPDTALLRARLSEANAINARVQANARHAALLEARDAARADLKDARGRIAGIDAAKQQQLAAAAFPVPGLSFSDEGLMFDGLPFEQASYAQQLRVAVAMGLASNPTLKVLLIKHGNALDQQSLQLLTAMAEEAGAQVWIERVAESPDGVSVFIEHGALVTTPEATAAPTRVCVECGVEWQGSLRQCTCDAPAAVAGVA